MTPSCNRGSPAAFGGIALNPLFARSHHTFPSEHSDRRSWKPVADILERDGYSVYIVQEPETTFDADIAATRAVLDRSGPCVLVGHSYGGMIISEVGNHPSVRSLVYVAAFEPEVGEPAGELQNKIPPASKSVLPAGNGLVQVKPEAFAEDFAADLPKSLAHFMSISQVPISAAIFDANVTMAAWSQKLSYAVIARQDRMIDPALEAAVPEKMYQALRHRRGLILRAGSVHRPLAPFPPTICIRARRGSSYSARLYRPLTVPPV